jgi:hypothetical protein
MVQFRTIRVRLSKPAFDAVERRLILEPLKLLARAVQLCTTDVRTSALNVRRGRTYFTPRHHPRTNARGN